MRDLGRTQANEAYVNLYSPRFCPNEEYLFLERVAREQILAPGELKIDNTD